MASFGARKVTKQITLLKSTWESVKPKITPNVPLSVLFMPFLGSKLKHRQQYFKLYEDFYRPLHKPVDIFLVQANLLDFIAISRGKRLSSNILNVIEENRQPSSKLIVHGISVGNFVHAINLQYDKNNTYQSKIIPQIFDSHVYGGPVREGGLERIMKSILETTLFKNKSKNTLAKHMTLNAASCIVTPNTEVFDDYITTFLTQSRNAPILTFYSTDDVMIDASKYSDVVKNWKEGGVSADAVCFNASVHAKHIIQHPKTFKSRFDRFLSTLPLYN